MDSDSDSSGHGPEDTNRLRESVSMVIRQLQLHPPHTARVQSEEIPESEEEHGGGDDDGDGDRDRDRDINNYDDGTEDDSNNDNDYEEPPQRRHSISSAESNYSPSATSSNEAAAYYLDQSSVKAEPDARESEEDAEPTFPTTPRRPLPPLSPHTTIPPTPIHNYLNYHPSPLKRSRSRSRSPTPAPSRRPFKRLKAPLNHAYVSLLNADILDASTRFAPHSWPAPATKEGEKEEEEEEEEEEKGDNDDDGALQPSQIGLSHWTAAEKTLLFEALARLGADDARGIATRVRTKSEFEVAAYLALLGRDTAVAAGRRHRHRHRPPPPRERIVLGDLPAAVELSQACVAALEEAADAVSLRQEAYEDTVERRRWEGKGGFWEVSEWNRRELEEAQPEGMPSVQFFRMRNWLRLTERVFMNSAVEEGNWREMVEDEKEERPGIRATALEDFYALVISVTRRLIAATAYVAESRVRAKREIYSGTTMRATVKDVEAAALSLGLRTNSWQFWAKCARRLRLDVYDDEGGGAVKWNDEEAPMSYDEVERALGLELENGTGENISDEEPESSEEEKDTDDNATSISDAESIELGAGWKDESGNEKLPGWEENEVEKEDIDREINELLVHSALEYPNTKRARDALRRRIRAARAHEAYADALDAGASYSEEKRLWAMLDRQPPVELTRVEVPGGPPKRGGTVDELITGFSRTPGSGDWRSKMEAVPSRWEMEYALVREEREDKINVTSVADSGEEI
ncbi:RNA polymerase I-specific transcription initiation factor rrn5 [Madurella mycetomatis]|uniref:RNA polymerase I-specific transcription initiation factor rrn5 n=1 Tax=Madurella mycetomatis TaxID=100816 RepID=A0A175W9D7_9PEZI|nr:RNA polymerase I-specific transcription initiation factor rrn5 [Madurella mycetomatis]